jgi:predicted ATPase/DNA-binding SARP family transcriptional activator
MTEHLTIRTLGGLAIQLNGNPIEFETQKEAALLVYLACTGRTHPREVLAEMMWEERTQSQALANLRHVLAQLRQRVEPYVTITRQSVAMNTESDWWLDVTEFENQLDVAEGRNVEQLEAALDLYQGDFLAGSYVDSMAFEDWALLERERLRFHALDALDTLVCSALVSGDHATGIARSMQLLQIDPLREETHRQLIELYARAGQRHAALDQYDKCRALLMDEIGVEPMPDTVALYEQIRAGKLAPDARDPVPAVAPERVAEAEPADDSVFIPTILRSLAAPRHNLPRQSTSFVGRETEIAEVRALLADPDRRLLTLVGSGGMGKTRLALAVAERLLDDFAQGVFFVPLAPLSAPASIVPAIASATGFQFYQSPDSQEQQLLNYLRKKAMLLVLDSFEHLLDGADLVDAILATAPDVQVIATSREGLNLGWEWRYEVEGLMMPNDGEAVEHVDAVRLFIERARRVQRGFSLAANRACVIDVCQLVDGMPLGIELAAAWLRMLPCDEIAGELLDLESPRRDAPDRHSSLRALFEHTWDGLSVREQRVFMALSVFRGGCTRQAAEAITRATTPLLAGLVNKSLLRLDYEVGRYEIHELLRQFAEEQLDVSGEGDAVRDAHSLYYLNAVAAHHPALTSPREVETLDAIESDLENVRAAWFWAIEREHFDAIENARQMLTEFFWRRDRNADGEEALGALVQALETDQPAGRRGVILGLALDNLAEFKTDNSERVALSTRSVAILRQLDSGDAIGWPLNDLAAYTGDFKQSKTLYLEALAAAEPHNDLQLIGAIKGNLGALLTTGMGQLDEGEHLLRENLAMYEAAGSVGGIAFSHYHLAAVETIRGNFDEAQRLSNDALAGFRDMGSRYWSSVVLHRLGWNAYLAGHPEQSRRYLLEALAILDDIGSTNARPHIMLSYTEQALGNYVAARHHLCVGLRYAVEEGKGRIRGMISGAMLAAHEGQLERAVERLALALEHPAMSYAYRPVAESLRDELEAELPPEVFAAAWERGQALDLDATVAELIDELSVE